MALNSALILTAGFGEGHNAAAHNLAAALRESGAACGVHDVFEEAYGPVNRLVRQIYLFVINHVPAVWLMIFWILDRTAVVGGGIGVFGRAARLLARLIEEQKPDVIVSTYPGYGHLMDLVRSRGEAGKALVVTVVTDSITVNSVWFRCGADAFFVANEETAEVMRSAGVPPEKIHATGFPVPLEFSGPAPERSGPPYEVLFMVNSAHHLASEIVAALLPIESIRLTVTVGRDGELGRGLERLAADKGVPLEVHGWTPDIGALIRRSHLLISKAGGATVQEALAACTPMILTQVVPGQEEGNARLLIESGAGELAAGAREITAAVQRTFSGGAEVYARRLEAAKRLSRPDAARAATRILRTLTT